MSRWRPPETRGSCYITAAGFAALSKELKELWQKRHKVTQALAAAAAEGDRSENAEYIYRKKQLREIDRRLRYLQQRTDELKIVDRPPDDRQRIYFGAWVVLEDKAGREYRYRIVGTDEIDPRRGYISIDSPVARSLLKKTIDDEVMIELPQGIQHYLIVDINYE